jgi:hypothetical protein
LHQALIARCDCLGDGELVGLPLAHVFKPANAGVPGECCRNQAGLRSLFCHMVASSDPSVA